MKNLLIILISLFIMSCGGGYKEGVINREEAAFIKLSGQCYNSWIQIDEGKKRFLDKNCNNKIYKLSTGMHKITIFKNKKPIYQKEIIFNNNITEEIIVP